MIDMDKEQMEQKPGGMEMCLPAAALAVDGTEPEVGDEVEFTVKGKISRNEAGKAYLKPEMINGAPLPEMPDKKDEMGELENMAAKMDAGEEY